MVFLNLKTYFRRLLMPYNYLQLSFKTLFPKVDGVDIYRYSFVTVDCKWVSRNRMFTYIATTSSLVQLAAPIVPIILSCGNYLV